MFLVVVVIASFVLRRTVSGRYVYAVGSNPESARLTGDLQIIVGVLILAGVAFDPWQGPRSRGG